MVQCTNKYQLGVCGGWVGGWPGGRAGVARCRLQAWFKWQRIQTQKWMEWLEYTPGILVPCPANILIKNLFFIHSFIHLAIDSKYTSQVIGECEFCPGIPEQGILFYFFLFPIHKNSVYRGYCLSLAIL